MDVDQARWSRRVMIHISPLVRAAFADDGVGRPEQRMGVAVAVVPQRCALGLLLRAAGRHCCFTGRAIS